MLLTPHSHRNFQCNGSQELLSCFCMKVLLITINRHSRAYAFCWCKMSLISLPTASFDFSVFISKFWGKKVLLILKRSIRYGTHERLLFPWSKPIVTVTYKTVDQIQYILLCVTFLKISTLTLQELSPFFSFQYISNSG